jgi:hypothetical protein
MKPAGSARNAEGGRGQRGARPRAAGRRGVGPLGPAGAAPSPPRHDLKADGLKAHTAIRQKAGLRGVRVEIVRRGKG